MGYSLSVLLKNPKQKKSVDSWLEVNYKPLSVVDQRIQNDYAGFQVEPSYAPEEFMNRLVGMDFNSTGIERNYIFAIIKLLAIHLGERTEDVVEHWMPPKNVRPEKTVPFYFYDTEKMPIFLSSIWKEMLKNSLPQKQHQELGRLLTSENGLSEKIEDVSLLSYDDLPLLKELHKKKSQEEVNKTKEYLRKEKEFAISIYQNVEMELDNFKAKLLKDLGSLK